MKLTRSYPAETITHSFDWVNTLTWSVVALIATVLSCSLVLLVARVIFG
ncbi:hypothetical protein ACAW74_05395 [Fibrella sp. WM1]